MATEVDLETIKRTFETARIRVEPQESEHPHWKLRGNKICVHYWPYTTSTFVYGKSFKAPPEVLAKAINSGRIKLPSEADEGKCKYCSQPIWWVVSPKAKKMAVQADGESHFCIRTFDGRKKR